MTLRGIARGWYGRLSLAFIHSLDQLAKEFEANFVASARSKPIIASLLVMRQKEDEPLGPYLIYFTKEIRAIPDTHLSPTVGGDSSSAGKAYAHVEVQKRPRARGNPEITFESKSEYPDHDDALVITTRIANACLKHIMIDTGSSS
ncbi:hypothetical protein BHE74_00056437 [Ensete ventricosum]|nr:hypothetical protein BHE74_00056437 [Ensete ventricosum]